MNEDKKWMEIAIQEAIIAEKEGEVPVGAILVRDNILIAKAHNQPIANNDATAHAEIQLIREAGSRLGNYRLTNTSLYVTLEPCAMCFGAMIHARVSRIVYGASDSKTGVCGSRKDFSNLDCFKHRATVNGGVLKKECSQMLSNFFKLRR